MITDDEKSIRNALKEILEFENYRVVEADNGEKATEIIKEDQTIDLVLLDIKMQGMDGMETYQALRRKPGCKGIPVVFMTAKVQSHEVQQYRDLSALDVISKPFDPMMLAGNVQAILDKQNG